jgi:phage-related protein
MRYNAPKPSLPKLRASFFRTALGAEPVREWLLSLPKSERRAIGKDIAYVQFKWPIGQPRVDHLRGGIWEIRSRIERRIARVLFAVEEQEIVLLHGFMKKSRRTPTDALRLAEKRLKDWHDAKEE